MADLTRQAAGGGAAGRDGTPGGRRTKVKSSTFATRFELIG